MDNIAASNVQMTPEHIARIEKASELPSEYPGWMGVYRLKITHGVVFDSGKNIRKS